jgi:hypothetical protein
LASNDLNISVPEFTVAGIPHGTLFAHRWYIGTDDEVSADAFRDQLDEHLKVLNDDYRVERSAALKDVEVTVLPTEVFYQWMRKKGKEGGQNKFPRVMKRAQFEEWEAYAREYKQLS